MSQLDACWCKGTYGTHFRLSSGWHSEYHFNVDLLFEKFPLLALDLCKELAEALQKELQDGFDPGESLVIGVATGGISVAQHVGGFLNIPHVWIDKKGIITDQCGVLEERSNAILVDDVLTFGGSLQKAVKSLETVVDVYSVTGVLLRRTRVMPLQDRKVISVLNSSSDKPIWPPGHCPMCSRGSRAMRPQEKMWASCTGT